MLARENIHAEFLVLCLTSFRVSEKQLLISVELFCVFDKDVQLNQKNKRRQFIFFSVQ